MDQQAKIAYINSQILCAQIEMNAMVAENSFREKNGDSPAYGEEAFLELINKYDISQNAVIRYLTDWRL